MTSVFLVHVSFGALIIQFYFSFCVVYIYICYLLYFSFCLCRAKREKGSSRLWHFRTKHPKKARLWRMVRVSTRMSRILSSPCMRMIRGLSCFLSMRRRRFLVIFCPCNSYSIFCNLTFSPYHVMYTCTHSHTQN
jgi:hypothetical protein